MYGTGTVTVISNVLLKHIHFFLKYNRTVLKEWLTQVATIMPMLSQINPPESTQFRMYFVFQLNSTASLYVLPNS